MNRTDGSRGCVSTGCTGLAERVTARKSLFLVSHSALRVSLLADHYCRGKQKDEARTRRPVQHGRTNRRKADRFIGLWPNEMPFSWCACVRTCVRVSWRRNIPRNNNSGFRIAVVNLAPWRTDYEIHRNTAGPVRIGNQFHEISSLIKNNGISGICGSRM